MSPGIGPAVLAGESNIDVQLLAHAPTCDKEQSCPASLLAAAPYLPLHCARRTFTACLILAWKFLHDRAPSNIAWTRVVGLCPIEIGYCERAVGTALEWRLWVGKCPETYAERHERRADDDIVPTPIDAATPPTAFTSLSPSPHIYSHESTMPATEWSSELDATPSSCIAKVQVDNSDALPDTACVSRAVNIHSRRGPSPSLATPDLTDSPTTPWSTPSNEMRDPFL